MPFMNIKTWIAAGALAVVVVGGSITGATVHNAQVQADAQAQHVLVVKAAAIAQQNAADAAAAQAVIDAAAAQKVLDDAAAAKAAADALAAKQAADAAAAQAAATAAAQAAAVKTVAIAPVKRTAVAAPTVSTGWAAGQAPKGTRIPTFTVTDPNAANYGQLDIVDPGTFCASHAGSGPVGSATCD